MKVEFSNAFIITKCTKLLELNGIIILSPSVSPHQKGKDASSAVKGMKSHLSIISN